MKKIILTVTLLLLLVALIACQNETVTTTETTATSTATSTATDTVTGGNTVPPIVAENYTAIPNVFEWTTDTVEPDYSVAGTGTYVIRKFDTQCNGYTKTYLRVDENGNQVATTRKDIQAMAYVGAIITQDDTAKTATIVVSESALKFEAEWQSVSAKGGAYLTFEFTTNMNATFCVTVTTEKGGSSKSAVEMQRGIPVTGDNGTYTGVAKLNVPRTINTKYYVNICFDDGVKYPVAASIPLTTTELWYEGPYTLYFEGDWQLIKDKNYQSKLANLFYTVYPRLYARWGTGSEPKTVRFCADSTYDGIAKAGGDKVTIAVDYANREPEDIGFFSHELTHVVQQYGSKVNYGADVKDGYGGWWRENLANYGGFRYFHWGTTANNVQIKDITQQKMQDWGYQSYGENSPFFTYMDDKYPTTDKNGDGRITSDEYGLIDAIHFLIKSNTGATYYDTPTATDTPIGQTVARVTGGKYACIEDLRKAFEKECEDGTWAIVGFGKFKDCFLTEGIPYLPDPDYPTVEQAVHGDKTATPLVNPVLEGANLALGARIVKFSDDTTKQPIKYLLDGDLKTYWQATSIEDYSFLLQGIPQGVVIDLGEVKSFNTYTIVCRGYDYANKQQNAKEWEILVSTDGKNYTSIDYQNNQKIDAVSFNVGDVSARYIEIRFYTTDQNNTDNIRIQEFMLFKQ